MLAGNSCFVSHTVLIVIFIISVNKYIGNSCFYLFPLAGNFISSLTGIFLFIYSLPCPEGHY